MLASAVTVYIRSRTKSKEVEIRTQMPLWRSGGIPPGGLKVYTLCMRYDFSLLVNYTVHNKSLKNAKCECSIRVITVLVNCNLQL